MMNLSSLIVLLPLVASLVMIPSVGIVEAADVFNFEILPSAFANHHSATVQNALGSSTPGCEETNECFIPSTVTIDVGGVVVWENVDNAAHTVTSGSPQDGPDGIFDSSLIMAGGAAFEHTFNEAGTFNYFCQVHPWMQAVVIVQEAMAEEEMMEEKMMEEKMMEEKMMEEKMMEEEMMMMMKPFDITAETVHNISGASVAGITTNSDDNSLIVWLDAAEGGELEINMNPTYITAFDDGGYFVLINNEEVEFAQSGNNLTIPFEFGAEKIEIYGSSVVPEFGTIAMIVLAVALVSIIAITAKTKIRLTPNL